MSRLFLGTLLSAAMIAGLSNAADSGLQQGDSIGAFYVTKVAGAPADGVPSGKELCYRCKYGQSPMVMVFTRKSGDKVTELVKQLDKTVSANEDARLRGFVTVLGEDQAGLKSTASKIAEAAGCHTVPVAVSSEPNGPANYRLDPSAEVTVIVAEGGKVLASHAFTADGIDVAAVLKEVEQAIN